MHALEWTIHTTIVASRARSLELRHARSLELRYAHADLSDVE